MNKKTLSSTLSRLRRYSLLGWFRFFYLKIVGKAIEIDGHCLMCGRCCQRVSLAAGGRWLRKQKDFDHVIKTHPEYNRFSIVGYDSQGFLLFSCSWYVQKAGICKDHDNRLSICRNFPDRELYFSGGEMIEGCGYSFRECVPFSSILRKEIEAADGKEKANSYH